MAETGLFSVRRALGGATLWRPHRGLLPLAPLYWAGTRLHAAWMRARAQAFPGPPLVIVGALRAGGSGKTSVTAALALALKARGFRVGILAWRIGKGLDGMVALPVAADSDWRISSDEAVMLARGTGCPVFAVRDRAAARMELSRGPYDVLISDDGFQDLRLRDAFRILVAAPAEAPGLFDLLPSGPFRETACARTRADLVLEGPWPEDAILPGPAAEGAHRFRRRFRMPPGLGKRPLIVLTALGDAGPFLADLDRAGIKPAAIVRGRNHREPPYAAIADALSAHPDARVLCTAKEGIRMEGDLRAPRQMVQARQEIILEEATLDRVAKACLSHRTSQAEADKTKLVH